LHKKGDLSNENAGHFMVYVEIRRFFLSLQFKIFTDYSLKISFFLTFILRQAKYKKSYFIFERHDTVKFCLLQKNVRYLRTSVGLIIGVTRNIIIPFLGC